MNEAIVRIVDRDAVFAVAVSRGVAVIVDRESALEAALTVELSADTWAGVILGQATLEAAYRAGELTVHGALRELLSLSRALQTRDDSQGADLLGDSTRGYH